MAIPKGKMAGLLLALAPKKGADKDEPARQDESYDKSELDSVIESLADAITSGDRGDIKDAFREFHRCITEEDKEQDEES